MTWHEWTTAHGDGWSHHGVATLPDGTIVGYHPRDRELLFFDGDGALLRSAPCDAVEAHDIAVDGDALWIADCGNKLCISGSGTPYADPARDDSVGQVLLVGLDGVTRRRITGWHDGLFLPTGVAIDPSGRGIWIADGYGSNRVDLVGPDDAVLVTIHGFDCPHGITVDRRGGEPLLYIAERGAHRIAVHDLEGAFVRHAGVGDLLAPCALTTIGDRLFVADLVARVTVLDGDDALVEHLGADADAAKRAGWPNAQDDGRTVRPPLAPGRFNSPHGITALGDDVVVTEWLLGGRWVRLRPGAAPAR